MRAHRITSAQFRDLAAGYGDEDAIGVLRDGQLSKRLILLREVVTAADHWRLRATANLDRAVELLDAAQRESPDAATTVLSHPFLDSWAMSCLRLLRRAEPGRDGSEAAAAQVGQLCGYAAAAAIRAGLSFDIPVPTIRGDLTLPTLGTVDGLGDGIATVHSGAGRVAVVLDDRMVTLPVPLDAPATQWSPIRAITVEHPGGGLVVTVDDTGPYRDLYHWRPAARLDAEQLRRFGDLLTDAWALIMRDHPVHARAHRAGLSSLVPLERPASGALVSAASRQASGSVAVVAEATDAPSLALLTIHEFQHMKLGALLDLVPLHRAHGAARHRAPWRTDPRPIGALLQGTYAHLAVTDFWRMRRRADGGVAAELEYAYWLAQTEEATATLAASGELTPEGEWFVAGIMETLGVWAQEPISPDIRSTVTDLLTASEADWRLRNLFPPIDGIELLAGAWQAGQRPSTIGASELRPPSAPMPATPPRIAQSLRHRAAGQPIEEQDVAVRAYLDGDWDVSAKEFQAAICDKPSNVDNWVGLCLACSRADPGGPVAQVFSVRPELFVAVYCKLRTTGVAPDLDDLARWLTASVTSGAARYRS
jgi:HEXXH motif-containing protein